jgi:hypothetical protein
MNTDPVAAAIEEAERIEAETRYRLQTAREAFQAGVTAGAAKAREALLQEQAAADRQLAARLMPILMSPDQAEMETRRWGPGGRAHFADPRPGDFPGRQANTHTQIREPETEPAPEREAQAG